MHSIDRLINQSIFINTTNKYSNKGIHEITLEVLIGQVIAETCSLYSFNLVNLKSEKFIQCTLKELN